VAVEDKAVDKEAKEDFNKISSFKKADLKKNKLLLLSLTGNDNLS
jgi:hypothetical protein